MDYTQRLLQVAALVCNVSSDGDGVKVVRTAGAQLASLEQTVLNAVRILALKVTQGNGDVSLEQMEQFKDAWEHSCQVLADALDSLLDLIEYLAVVEQHISDDVHDSLVALQDRNTDLMMQYCAYIRARCLRACVIVTAEMELQEKSMPAIRTFHHSPTPSFLIHFFFLILFYLHTLSFELCICF